MRTAQIVRNTTETQIRLQLNLDGRGDGEIETGCGFLDHMLTLFARHGRFDLTVFCKGDTQVDYHHTAEDIGIALGQAFDRALGDKRGINRYGSQILPMDESLILSAVDLSGRSFLSYALEIPTQKVGTFDTELVEEFFSAFAREAGITLHLQSLAGGNTHHIIEACFKAFGRVMRQATEADARAADAIPSTKGTLS